MFLEPMQSLFIEVLASPKQKDVCVARWNTEYHQTLFANKLGLSAMAPWPGW